MKKTVKKEYPKPTLRTHIIVFLAMVSPERFAKWFLSHLDHDQARSAFHDCPFPYNNVWQDTFRPKVWGKTWHLIFSRWLEAADSEGKVKGMFFEVHFGFEGDNPLKSAMVQKWLTFLTDWRDPKVTKAIWDLTWNWHTSDAGTGLVLLEKRRHKIAGLMLANATTSEQAQDAYEMSKPRYSGLPDGPHQEEAYKRYCELCDQERESYWAEKREKMKKS